MRKTKPPLLWLVLFLFIATGKEAHAYTDPGTGALIWQVLLGSFLGVMFYFRRILAWLRSKMRVERH